MEQHQENKMGFMPMGKLLFTMSWPATFSMIVHALYNIIDCIFVAAVSENALTAVTLVFPVQMLIISVGVGTGIGINSLIARRLGAQMQEDANMAASNGFRLSFVNWAAFACFGILFSRIYIQAFTNTHYVVENGTRYLFIITVFSIFVLTQINIEKILQATGNMIIPMICSLTGVTINIILDPIFIFGYFGVPRMGVTGAAVVTIIGQSISMCMGLIFLFTKKHAVQVRIKGFKLNKAILKEIYAVGVPSILMQSIGSIMIFGLNMILTTISETAVAVLGAYYRLQSFIFMPVFGVNQGAMPIIGYNYGARNKNRLVRGFLYAFGISLGIMLLGLVIFQLFARQVLLMFSPSDELLAMGIPALRLISLCFPAAALGITAATLFQAVGYGFLSLWGSLIRQLLGILPIAWFLARTASGAVWVWAAFPLAELLGLVYSLAMLRYVYKHQIKNLGSVD